MSKHSALPWCATDDPGFINKMIVDNEGRYVAEAIGKTHSNMLANAAFICKAVNLHADFLAVLERIILEDNNDKGRSDGNFSSDLFKDIQAIVAKAKE